MELTPIEPPRSFAVGARAGLIAHTADISLADDEQVTFRAPSGSELDVVRKSWGYYATPSLNGRMREHGLRAVLMLGQPRSGSESPRMYLLAVEEGREDDFHAYVSGEGMRVLCWLDGDEAVAQVARRLDAPG